MHQYHQHHHVWLADNPPASGSWGSLPISSGQRLNVNPSHDLAWSAALALPAGTSWSHHTPSTLRLGSQVSRLHSPTCHEIHSLHPSIIPETYRFHSPSGHQSARATHNQEAHDNARFDPYILYRHPLHPSLRSNHGRAFPRMATDFSIHGLSASSDDTKLNQDRLTHLLDQSAATPDRHAHRQDPGDRFVRSLDRPSMNEGAVTPIFENATSTPGPFTPTRKGSSHSSSRHTVTHRPWEDVSGTLLNSSYCRCCDSPGFCPPSSSPSSSSSPSPTSQFFIQPWTHCTKPKKFKPILVYQRPEDNQMFDSQTVEASERSISNWAGNRSCSPCCSDSSEFCYLANCTNDCEEQFVKHHAHKNKRVHQCSDRTSERSVSGSPCLLCEEFASAKLQSRHKRHQNEHPLALILNHNPQNFKTNDSLSAELQQNSCHLRVQNESDSQAVCRIETRVAPWLAASTQTLASQQRVSQDVNGISNRKSGKIHGQHGVGYRGDSCFYSDDLSPRRGRVSLPVAAPFMSQPNLAQLSHYRVRETNNTPVTHNHADIQDNRNFFVSMTHLPTSTNNFSVFHPTSIPRITTHNSFEAVKGQSPFNKPSSQNSFPMMDESAMNRRTLLMTRSETSPNSPGSFPATPRQDSFTPQVSCPGSPQNSCHQTCQDSFLMTSQSCPVTPQNLVPVNSVDSCPETHADPLAASMENQSSDTPVLLSDCVALRPSSLPFPNSLEASSSVTGFSTTEKTRPSISFGQTSVSTNLVPVSRAYEISPSGTNGVSVGVLTQNEQVKCPVTMSSNARPIVSGDEINHPVYSQSSSQLSTNTLVNELSGAGSFQHPSQPVEHCTDSKHSTSETATAKKRRNKRAFSCADFNISVLDFEDLLTPRVNLNQLTSQSMIDLSQIPEEALEFAPGQNSHSSRKIPKTTPGVNKCPRLLSALSVPNLHIPVTSSTTQPNVTPNKIPHISEVPELHIPEEFEARVLNTPIFSMPVLTSTPTLTSVVGTSLEASFVLPFSPTVQTISFRPDSKSSVAAAILSGTTTTTTTTATALSCPTPSSVVPVTSALSFVPPITSDIPMTPPVEGDDVQEWSRWKCGGSFLQMLHTNDQPADGNNYPLTPLSRLTPPPQDVLASRVVEHSHLVPLDFPAYRRVDPSPSFLHTTLQRDQTPYFLQPTQQSDQTTSLPTAPTEARGDKGKRDSRLYRCPYCGMLCTSQGQLRGHLRVHTGEKPFRCECGRAFARNEELTRHRRIHLGLRPFTCHICSKSFGRKDHLSKHEKTHLGNNEKKIHGCQVSGCGQAYTRSDALARHQYSAHGIRAKTARFIRTLGQSEDGDESSIGSPMF